MHLVLFSVFALCIAGSRAQEIAIGTEYLRAHTNGSFPSESAINAQGVPALPPVGVYDVGVNTASSTTTATTTTAAGTTKAAAAAAGKASGKGGAKATGGVTSSTASSKTNGTDESSEEDDKHKSHDHDHDSHHEHDATISVDVHNVLDLFKQQIHETEERILAAIHHEHKDHRGHKDHHSSNATVVKSYRTADR